LQFTRGKVRRSEQFIWECRGNPVVFAGFSPTGVSGARVGPVITIPTERRKGFASAAVAALSQRLLDDGHAWCGLFADVENLESNRIYQRLGYRETCRFRSIELAVSA
ncbi:MAG: GNAT family N-acetyltransferase, partial [Proteobacteria bacterium]|nr:GNAT family N-acetyltransferase [Pseudomonadota bacterium]